VYHRTPTWRLHTRLCKFARNISTNVSTLGQRTHLKLGELSSLFIFSNITISWPYLLNGFWYDFLLRDNKNALYALFFDCLVVASTLIAVFDLTILVRQGSFDVYQLTEHGVRVLVFNIIISLFSKWNEHPCRHALTWNQHFYLFRPEINIFEFIRCVKLTFCCF